LRDQVVVEILAFNGLLVQVGDFSGSSEIEGLARGFSLSFCAGGQWGFTAG